jgi:hypothetical protein
LGQLIIVIRAIGWVATPGFERSSHSFQPPVYGFARHPSLLSLIILFSAQTRNGISYLLC